MLDTREPRQRAARIETLVGALAAHPDPDVAERARELVQALLALYGDALARMLELTMGSATSGADLVAMFARDELVGSMLLLHGLHPVALETRITQALDEVRPYLRSHGGNVELVAIAGGVAHLRLEGTCHGCPSSTVTLKLAIEEAINKAAPDLVGLQVEGVTDPPPQLITLTPNRGRKPAASTPAARDHVARDRAAPDRAAPDRAAPDPAPTATWLAVSGIAPLNGATVRAADVLGRPLIFFQIAGVPYAYVSQCAACASSLDGATLEDAALTCPVCRRRYDVRGAGRAVEVPDMYLQPVPLLVDHESLMVALPSEVIASESDAQPRTGVR